MSNETQYTTTGIFGGHFLAAAARDGTRPTAEMVLRSIKRNVQEWDWRTVVSISRRLYANMGVPRGAVNLKAILSVGEAWDPIYVGPDTAWGKVARDFLVESFYTMGNVRGPLFDFKTSRVIDSITMDRCGDYFYLLSSSDTGFPMVQAIPNHLIRNPPGTVQGRSRDIEVLIPRHLTDEPDTADNKPLMRKVTAAAVWNGVAFNMLGRPFAYCVFEEVAQDIWPMVPSYKWVHEQYIVHSFDPEWYEQGRGFPAFAHAVRTFMSMLTSQEFEEITHMILSSISLVEHNEEGMSDQADPTQQIGSNTLKENLDATVAGEVPEVIIERIVGGVVKYFKSGTGGKVEPMSKDSPGDMWDKFQDRMIRTSLAGINMPYSIVWKGNDDNGTSNRVSIEKLQRTVAHRQRQLKYPALRQIRYAIVRAMKLGIIPMNKDSWHLWDFTMPAEFVIDDGRISDSDRKDLASGVQNLSQIISRRWSRSVDVHLRERAEEEALKQIIAAETTKKYAAQGVEVTPDMLGNPMGPYNGQTPEPSTDESGDAEDQKKGQPEAGKTQEN